MRGLFLQHTRTGNPLVDSVAEHQPTTQDAYWRYLHYACLMMPLGLIACFFNITNGKIFLIQVWGCNTIPGCHVPSNPNASRCVCVCVDFTFQH